MGASQSRLRPAGADRGTLPASSRKGCTVVRFHDRTDVLRETCLPDRSRRLVLVDMFCKHVGHQVKVERPRISEDNIGVPGAELCQGLGDLDLSM